MNQANPQEHNIKVANVFTGKTGEQVPTEKGNCPDATEQKGVRFSQPSINTQSYMLAFGFKAYFPQHTQIFQHPHNSHHRPYAQNVRAGGGDQNPAP